MTQQRRHQPRKPGAHRPRQQPPQGTRVTVTVHPLTTRQARTPVDRARYARSVGIAYLVVLAAAILAILALAGVL